MARIVKDWPRTRGRLDQYPWDEWFDYQKRALVRKKDFNLTAAGFVASVHRAAKLRGVQVRTATVDDVVYVQALRDGAA